MGWSEPPISGEVWDNVVRGKFPLIDSEIVRAYAVGYGSFQSVVDETASETGAVAKICGQSFGGLLLTAPEEKYAKLGQDGARLSARAESWAARLNRVADLVDEAQQKIVWTVIVVAVQVAQLTARNRGRGEIAPQLQALYDEGHKQVGAIYDALLENPDLAMPDDSETTDSDGSSSEENTTGLRGGGKVSAVEAEQAVKRDEPAPAKAPAENATTNRDGSPVEPDHSAEGKDERAAPSEQKSQAVAAQTGQSATGGSQPAAHSADAPHPQSATPSAATHAASAAPVAHMPGPSAHPAPVPQQSVERPGFFAAPASFSRPAQPQQRSSQTVAQSGAQAAAPSQPAQEQHREDHLVGHDQMQHQSTWSDGSAVTSAMGAAAVAPPSLGHMGWSAPVSSWESRTGWSAASMAYQAECGHALGMDGVLASTGGNEAFLAWAQGVVGAAAGSARLGGTEIAGVAEPSPVSRTGLAPLIMPRRRRGRGDRSFSPIHPSPWRNGHSSPRRNAEGFLN